LSIKLARYSVRWKLLYKDKNGLPFMYTLPVTKPSIIILCVFSVLSR